MSAGTRSRAITAAAPASSAIFACSGVVTSMITPPFSISASPTFSSKASAPVRPAPFPPLPCFSFAIASSCPGLQARELPNVGV